MLEEKTADSVLERTVAGCGHTQSLGLSVYVYRGPSLPSCQSILDRLYHTRTLPSCLDLLLPT